MVSNGESADCASIGAEQVVYLRVFHDVSRAGQGVFRINPPPYAPCADCLSCLWISLCVGDADDFGVALVDEEPMVGLSA